MEVSPDDPTKIPERLNNDRVTALRFRILFRQTRQPADPPHPLRLLCARGERPRCCSAAEKRDEIAPLHAPS
jgi:hypothetical protein